MFYSTSLLLDAFFPNLIVWAVEFRFIDFWTSGKFTGRINVSILSCV